VGNVGDNSISSYRLHASEIQQLSCAPIIPMADATPIWYLCGVARGSRQPMTGRLATHPSNTTVKIYTVDAFFSALLHDLYVPMEICSKLSTYKKFRQSTSIVERIAYSTQQVLSTSFDRRRSLVYHTERPALSN